MKINEENIVKFDFELWTYYEKFDFKTNWKKIIKNSVLYEYVFVLITHVKVSIILLIILFNLIVKLVQLNSKL